MKQPLTVSVRRASAQSPLELIIGPDLTGPYILTLGQAVSLYPKDTYTRHFSLPQFHHIPREAQAEWEALGWRCRGSRWDGDLYLLGEWTGDGLPVKPS